MPEYIEKAELATLPAIVLRGIAAFPSVVLNFELSDDINISAAEAAEQSNSFVLLIAARHADADLSASELSAGGLFAVGTVAKIKQSVKGSDGSLRLIAEGFSRAQLISLTQTDDYFTAEVMSKTIQLADNGGIKGAAFIREALSALSAVLRFLPSVSDDVMLAAQAIENPGMLADFIASNVMVRPEDKQKVLECFEPMQRIETLILLLRREEELLNCEYGIHKKVRARLNGSQRERYLREQLRAIEEELGDDDDENEYLRRIINARLPREVLGKLLREHKRMRKSHFSSAEASVLRNYLDTCLELPWKKTTHDRTNIAAAKKILEADHDGLDKIKERILEFLAVKQLNPELKNQIICLVGPPGTGKTSIAQSIARAMHRKFVRVSLGGIHDESDIRGHRKTYVAAMPGRIINAILQVKVKNPVMLLDEIDKVSSSAHGDPQSALLEVLDPEQNKCFRDHFIELPFDLSDCVFICTANSLDNVPRPLIDRMEVIELTSYTRREKLEIAKHHLLPKQMKRHGLNGRTLRVGDEAVYEIIDNYTHEAGVRNLERLLAALCRKAAMRIVTQDVKRVTVAKAADVESFLGVRKTVPEKVSAFDEVGIVNGLAFTEVGGDMLKIETAILEGTGKIELTGSLGDVMKESAKTAVSFIRSVASELGISPDFYKTKDIHIHVPEGAVPKDGPSAGITIMTALASALTGRAVCHDLAMTGEMTLRGNVLAIGGLREKTMAAYACGVKRVIIPADNVSNLEDIDSEARANLTFIPVRHASEVLRNALLPLSRTSLESTPVTRLSVETTDGIPLDAPAEMPKGEIRGA